MEVILKGLTSICARSRVCLLGAVGFKLISLYNDKNDCNLEIRSNTK